MTALMGFTAGDIATIASAGVAGLALVFVLVLLAKPKLAPPRIIWACLAVIVLTAAVQIGTIYINAYTKARITV